MNGGIFCGVLSVLPLNCVRPIYKLGVNMNNKSVKYVSSTGYKHLDILQILQQFKNQFHKLLSRSINFKVNDTLRN